MKNLKNISVLLMVFFVCVSCKEYLDVKPKGEVIPKTAEEFASLRSGSWMQMTAASSPAMQRYRCENSGGSDSNLSSSPSGICAFCCGQGK